MRTKKIVLVIEDHQDIARSYKYFLEEAGYEVELTDTKREAVEKLRCRTFDAALVDLQLKDDITHKGGLEVLNFIERCNEGTKVVVISATAEVRDAVKSFRSGISDFIIKGDHDSSRDILVPIEKALIGAEKSYFGDYNALAPYLAAPDMAPIWESWVQEILQCGYDELHKLLWKELKGHLPILRKKDGSPSLAHHTTDMALSGLFWSKGEGFPIWISLAAKEGRLIQPPSNSAHTPLPTATYRKIQIGLWKMLDAKRDDFLENIRDKPWQKGESLP